MKKIGIVKGVGCYYLKYCPNGKKLPSTCQTEGCRYWNGYVFLDARYDGMKDYICGSWRKIINSEIKVADYVKCSKEYRD